MENPIVPEQASSDGDAQAVTETGQTVSVIPQEDAGTAATNDDPKKEAKDWRKSEKEWQDMKEASKKGETAAVILEKLSSALGIEKPEVEEPETDPLQLITKKVDDLQTELALSKWEKSHPAVDTAENREAWTDIVKTKGHLVKSGDLTYDDLWSMVRKGSKPSTSTRDFKDQELNIGSVPAPSKSVVSGTEIDPDVAAVMRKAGYSEEQIRLSA
jgi:ATP:corrinoid adenosyltransferase